MQRVNADRLVRDLHAVVADAEELLRAVAGNASEAIAGARERIEASLRAAKDHHADTKSGAAKEDGVGAQSPNAHSLTNIWMLLAIAAGAGILAGLIISRGSDSRRPPEG